MREPWCCKSRPVPAIGGRHVSPTHPPRSDLKQYSALVERFGPAASLLKERYEMLWELGHLYVVRPENLRSLLQEGHLGKLDPKLIYPYISNRGDFGTAHVDQLFPDMEKSFSRLLSL